MSASQVKQAKCLTLPVVPTLACIYLSFHILNTLTEDVFSINLNALHTACEQLEIKKFDIGSRVHILKNNKIDQKMYQ